MAEDAHALRAHRTHGIDTTKILSRPLRRILLRINTVHHGESIGAFVADFDLLDGEGYGLAVNIKHDTRFAAIDDRIPRPVARHRLDGRPGHRPHAAPPKRLGTRK